MSCIYDIYIYIFHTTLELVGITPTCMDFCGWMICPKELGGAPSSTGSKLDEWKSQISTWWHSEDVKNTGFLAQVKDVYRTKLRSVFLMLFRKSSSQNPKKNLKSGVTQSRPSNVAPLQVLENSASSVLWKGGCQQDDWSVSTQVHLWTDLGSEAKDAYKVGNWCTGVRTAQNP